MRVNGQALAAIRERSGLTQSELAKRTGVSQGRISRLEGSDRPVNARPATVLKLAEALAIPMVALVHHETEAKAS